MTKKSHREILKNEGWPAGNDKKNRVPALIARTLSKIGKGGKKNE